MDGLLFIDKPTNMTSHDVVNIARGVLGTKKIGHTGTLDPNATGILVLCIGKATKLVKYFSNNRKTYQATIIIGKSYDTDDTTGKLIAEKSVDDLTVEKVTTAVLAFIGTQKQTPPDYSAVKINGKKLYELARKNIEIGDKGSRDVEIHRIDKLEIEFKTNEVWIKMEIEVSKGTYIRSIARDLGEKLDNYGCLHELNRTRVDQIDISESITIDELNQGKYQIRNAFDYLQLPRIVVDDAVKSYIDNGRFLDPELFPEKTETILYSKANEPLAIYYYDEKKETMRMSVKWC